MKPKPTKAPAQLLQHHCAFDKLIESARVINRKNRHHVNDKTAIRVSEPVSAHLPKTAPNKFFKLCTALHGNVCESGSGLLIIKTRSKAVAEKLLPAKEVSSLLLNFIKPKNHEKN